MHNVAIIDYGSGNLHSALKAFERAARDSGSALKPVLTSDPDVVASADALFRPVFPGRLQDLVQLHFLISTPRSASILSLLRNCRRAFIPALMRFFGEVEP